MGKSSKASAKTESKISGGKPDETVEQATTDVKTPAEPKAPVAKTRGPKGVAETATITLISTANPKRDGSKASKVFSHYVQGMTIAAFAEALKATDPALEKEATPNLVYDAKHGFISIDGYDPGAIVQPKPKAEKKTPAKKVKSEADKTADATSEAEKTAETME